VSVFGVAVEAGGRMMCDAAVDAAFELGVFDALPATFDELAAATGVRAGHRLRTLVDVLVALGAIVRREAGVLAVGTPPPRPSHVIREGWGRLAEVIRSDRPLVDHRDPELVRRMHRHLADVGVPAARELAGWLGSQVPTESNAGHVVAGDRGDVYAGDVVGAGDRGDIDGRDGGGVRPGRAFSLIDLGGGAGVYTAAFLDRFPASTATLVDTDEVIAIAREHLGGYGDRVQFVAGDARDLATVGGGHRCALLANLLHLHAAADCAMLIRSAACAVASGGLVVIHDLRVDVGRDGPLESLLFALGMAIYTDDGDVYDTAQLRAWLAAAGLESIEEHRLAAAPTSIVLVGRRPPPARDADAELDAALAATAESLGSELRFPAQLRAAIARAIVEVRGGGFGGTTADDLVRHYTDVMPRMRVAQLARADDPAATLFHTPLDWSRLPRLGTALDRLFATLAHAGVDATTALAAPSSDRFRARTPTLAALYERTHYGGLMPLLYGYPADLAYFASRGLDVQETIDRYLTAPIVHELCHFAPDRTAIESPHFDECIGGWLGVHVHPELAYPVPGEDDALYAAPWLAQVGQAVARAFGIDAVVRAQAGAARWEDATSPSFVDAAATIGRADWRARRTLHLLSDTFDPTPWVALAFAARAGRSLDGETYASLAAIPLTTIAPPADPDFDRAVVEDALRAMCLDNVQIGGSFRARTRIPDVPIEIDARTCRVTRPLAGRMSPNAGPMSPNAGPMSPNTGPTSVDSIPPTYWLPPGVATALAARGFDGYELTLRTIEAIPAAAQAICAASKDVDEAGFALVARGRSGRQPG
jgi:O-methyltransferase domain